MSRLISIAAFVCLSLGLARSAHAESPPFEIVSGLSPDLCLRPLGPPQAGTPLGIGRCEHGMGSWFREEGPTIRFEGGLCVDDRGGAGNQGDELILYPCHGRENQQWFWTPERTIRGIHGLCMDVRGGAPNQGTPVIIFGCHGRVNQQWSRRSPEAPRAMEMVGSRLMSRLAPDLCLNVLGGMKLGATVGVWRCENGENSRFEFRDGRIKVGGLCLAAGERNGVVAAPCDSPSVFQWMQQPNGSIQSADGRCLDVEGGRAEPGNRTIMWSCKGSPNQLWDMVR